MYTSFIHMGATGGNSLVQPWSVVHNQLSATTFILFCVVALLAD